MSLKSEAWMMRLCMNEQYFVTQSTFVPEFIAVLFLKLVALDWNFSNMSLENHRERQNKNRPKQNSTTLIILIASIALDCLYEVLNLTFVWYLTLKKAIVVGNQIVQKQSHLTTLCMVLGNS